MRLLFITMAAMFALAGCEKEGPAERAGEQVDEAMEDAKDVGEDMADKVEDAADEVEDKIDN